MAEYVVVLTFNDAIGGRTLRNGEIRTNVKKEAEGSHDFAGEVLVAVITEVEGGTVASKDLEEGFSGRDSGIVECGYEFNERRKTTYYIFMPELSFRKRC